MKRIIAGLVATVTVAFAALWIISLGITENPGSVTPEVYHLAKVFSDAVIGIVMGLVAVVAWVCVYLVFRQILE